MTQKDQRLFMRVDQDFLKKIDDWRREQSDLPSRSEAIRRLIEAALQSASKKR
jgi:metal-responsive CopG/Arc/MetJ family transcriptional regulator